MVSLRSNIAVIFRYFVVNFACKPGPGAGPFVYGVTLLAASAHPFDLFLLIDIHFHKIFHLSQY